METANLHPSTGESDSGVKKETFYSSKVTERTTPTKLLTEAT